MVDVISENATKLIYRLGGLVRSRRFQVEWLLRGRVYGGLSLLTCGRPPRAMRFKFTLSLVAYRAPIGQYGFCLDEVS